jgi:hypothetical protein
MPPIIVRLIYMLLILRSLQNFVEITCQDC